MIVYHYCEEADSTKEMSITVRGDGPYAQICNLLIDDSEKMSDRGFPPVGLCGIRYHDHGHIAICYWLTGQAYSRTHELYIFSDQKLSEADLSGIVDRHLPDSGEDEEDDGDEG